jgi:hypothetical protein
MQVSQTHGSGGLVIGALLVALGLVFTAAQLLGVGTAELFWPFFLILPGVFMLALMAVLGRAGAGLAVPGCIVTTIGLLLLYQNTTGHWESWAYAWALIPAAVGAGLYLLGLQTDDPGTRQTGKLMAFISLAVFFFAALFFEVVLNLSGLFVVPVAWLVGPALLIAGGLVLLFGRGGTRAER